MFVAADEAQTVWDAVLESGQEHGPLPVGLGARDTLRPEAGLPLYGQDISEDVDVLSAGLGFIVDWEKPSAWCGRKALEELRASGAPKRRIGLELVGRGIARTGHDVLAAGETVGQVTSGTFSPTLEKAIAMALIGADTKYEIGDALAVSVRGRSIEAVGVPIPFYKRPRRRAPGKVGQ